MLAHADFEREFYMLQAAISGEPEFGKDNRWAAEDRPKKLAKLIRDHLGSIPEADRIRRKTRSLRSGASARPVAPAPREATQPYRRAA